MGNVGAGEMILFAVIIIIFAIEAGVLAYANPNPQPIWTPSTALSSVVAPTPNVAQGGCGWNIFCTVSNTGSSILYFAEEFVYVVAQIFAALTLPISAVIEIATYSAIYGGILAWFNGIMGAIATAIFIHGVV